MIAATPPVPFMAATPPVPRSPVPLSRQNSPIPRSPAPLSRQTSATPSVPRSPVPLSRQTSAPIIPPNVQPYVRPSQRSSVKPQIVAGGYDSAVTAADLLATAADLVRQNAEAQVQYPNLLEGKMTSSPAKQHLEASSPYPNLLGGHVRLSPKKNAEESAQYPNLLTGKARLVPKENSEKPTADVKAHDGVGIPAPTSTQIERRCESPAPSQKAELPRCCSGDLREKVQQYYNLIGGGNAIDLQGLAKVRKALTRVLNLQDHVFGDLKEQVFRFDCDGDGLLDFHETYMCIKTNLLEHGAAFGYQKQGLLDIATRTPEEIGYQLMQEIGHGNQSRAYLAHNRTKRETCCIKTYRKSSMSKDDVDCLKDEFSALHLLAAHPNVASAADIFQDTKYYYMVQEVYTGGDFTTLRLHASNGHVKLNKSWWSGIFKQSFSGLAHLHQNALVHCDLKESNIMLKTDNYHQPEVIIIDLGLVRSAACTAQTVCGTPGYIAPEVWEHGKLYPGADIFAMGVIILQMLLDKVPPHHNPPRGCQVLPGGIFTEGLQTLGDVQRATRARTPPFHLLAEQWPHLATLTRSLLEKDVSLRPSATQVLRDGCFGADSEGHCKSKAHDMSQSKQSSEAVALEGKIKASRAASLLEKDVSLHPSAPQVVRDRCLRPESVEDSKLKARDVSHSKKSSESAALEGKVKDLLADLKELRCKIEERSIQTSPPHYKAELRSSFDDKNDSEPGFEMLWSWLM